MTVIHLSADTVNGVTKIDALSRVIDYPDSELLEPRDFIDQLDTLEEGELIYTAVTYGDEWHDKLVEEYGIN